MLPDDPRHGTYSGAQTHWRTETPICDPCRKAVARYQKRRNMDAARNIRRVVNAGPARRHLEQLKTAGMTDGAIAARAGVSITAVRWARVGKNDRILAATQAAILGVTASPHPTGWVDATGSRRRIQALAALGWPKHAIVAAATSRGHNLTYSVLAWISQGRATEGRVLTSTHQAIAAAYDELSMRLPESGRSSSKVRTTARLAGYAPPLAWNDIDNDSAPGTTCAEAGCANTVVRRGLCETHYRKQLARVHHKDTVDPVVVDRLLAGEHVPSTRAERDEAMRRWRAAGRSERSLCELFGWHEGRYGRDAA